MFSGIEIVFPSSALSISIFSFIYIYILLGQSKTDQINKKSTKWRIEINRNEMLALFEKKKRFKSNLIFWT